MTSLPRVCVIGAGSGGIAVVKALQDRGIPQVCYEQGDDLAGNGYFRHTNRTSAAYEPLHINTDSKVMEYRDYPIPVSSRRQAMNRAMARERAAQRRTGWLPVPASRTTDLF